MRSYNCRTSSPMPKCCVNRTDMLPFPLPALYLANIDNSELFHSHVFQRSFHDAHALNIHPVLHWHLLV
jgi:hypothetical protein